MKDWIKNNWFKLITIIILLLVSWYLIKYLDYHSQEKAFKVQNYTE